LLRRDYYKNYNIFLAAISLAKTNLKKGFIESSITQKPFAIEIGFTTDNVNVLIESAVNAGVTLI